MIARWKPCKMILIATWFLCFLWASAIHARGQEKSFREACEKIYGTEEVRPNDRNRQVPGSMLAIKVTVDALIETNVTLIGKLDIKNTCNVHDKLLKRLRGLEISSHRLSDLSPLSSLESLEELRLNNDGVVDIKPLARLLRLKAIDLSGNAILDVSALATLSGTVELRLAGNKIQDVTPLKSMANLETLHLEQNKIKDISALSGMPALAYLYLDNNSVESIKVLGELPALRDASLNGNLVSTGADFVGTHQIKIDLSNNPIFERRGADKVAVRWDDVVALSKKLRAFDSQRAGPMLIEWSKPYVLPTQEAGSDVVFIRSKATIKACLVYHPPMTSAGKVVSYFPICQVWPWPYD